MGIGATLFYLAFRNTDFKQLVSDFSHARYQYVIYSMIMGYLAFISRGMRWVLLLEPFGKKPNTWNSVHAVSIGYFTNLLIPRAGEVARCTSLKNTDNIPVNRLLGTVILERLVDMIMLIILMLVTVILDYKSLHTFFANTFNNPNADSSSGLAFKLIIAAIGLGFVVVLYFIRNKFSHLPIYIKVREFWQGIKEGIKSFSKLKKKGPFILHTLFIWLMYYLMVYICIFAMDPTKNLTPSDGLFVMVVAGLGMVVPSPGGIGSYHYLVMMGLAVFGIPKEHGVSFATLVHTGQLLMTFLAGAVAMAALYRLRRKNKKRPVNNTKQEPVH